MPIHDWTRVRANRFHDFHQSWTIRMKDALNAGLLPTGYLAMAEQKTGGPEPDVITLARPDGGFYSAQGTAVLDQPPKTKLRIKYEALGYARKANRIAIRHPDGELISIIEILSPGNKDSRRALGMRTRKVARYLTAGVHILIIDLFPPNNLNPQGIHKEICAWLHEEPKCEQPAGKPLTLAAYSAGLDIEAFIEPMAVGDVLTDMPIFLTPDRYVNCPLEATYMSAWDAFPAALKEPLL